MQFARFSPINNDLLIVQLKMSFFSVSWFALSWWRQRQQDKKRTDGKHHKWIKIMRFTSISLNLFFLHASFTYSFSFLSFWIYLLSDDDDPTLMEHIKINSFRHFMFSFFILFYKQQRKRDAEKKSWKD